jgi:hypothetical protein
MAKTPTATTRKPAKAEPIQRKNMSRVPRGSLTVDNVVAALRNNAGIRAHAAERLKVSRAAVTMFIKRHPEIVEIEREIREEMLDLTEGKLFKQIGANEFPAIKFFLEHQGGERGYGRNRFEVSGPNGKPIEYAAKPDYSNLTVEEMRTLEAILVKAGTVAANGGGS